ncbi:MAG: hypothetical protein K2J17_00185 [Paramuribaculum sp.]|nr:hypothetical protein [Paramuribaculum sp.]MDE6782116.1 hypothetical protein [Paramuribaculum sp.]
MPAILSSDLIFATIMQRGRVVADLTLQGITSLTDVLTSTPGLSRGLARISLRNSSQGWSHTSTVMLGA